MICIQKPIFQCDAETFALGLALAKFRVGNTNILVSKNAKICVTPNAKSQSESVENRLRWVPNGKFVNWPCTFNFVVVDFICVGCRFSVEYGLKSYQKIGLILMKCYSTIRF